jgi:hypothetical protein
MSLRWRAKKRRSPSGRTPARKIGFLGEQTQGEKRIERGPGPGDVQRGAISLPVGLGEQLETGHVAEHEIERAGVATRGVGVGADQGGQAAMAVGEEGLAVAQAIAHGPG